MDGTPPGPGYRSLTGRLPSGAMRAFNVFDGPTEEADPTSPAGHRAPRARFAPPLAAPMLGATVHARPPGQSNAPYHYELGDEECLVVLQGEPTLRAPD